MSVGFALGYRWYKVVYLDLAVDQECEAGRLRGFANCFFLIVLPFREVAERLYFGLKGDFYSTGGPF